jgi:hypothetical protein
MITLAEPTTALTDYALAAVSAVLGWSLFRRRDGQRARTLWALAFAALALTALVGGTYHGFAIATLWPVTVALGGVIAFAMLTGSAMATTTGRVRRAIIAAAAVQLIVFLVWTRGHDDFSAIILDSGVALLAVAALHAPAALIGRDATARAIVAGVVLAIVGAAIQASGVSLHRHFNHNDLFHVVQIAGALTFYRGARCLRDRP